MFSIKFLITRLNKNCEPYQFTTVATATPCIVSYGNWLSSPMFVIINPNAFIYIQCNLESEGERENFDKSRNSIY